MKGRKYLASALLAGMVMSPAVFAQVSALNDDVLADVSAQGVQVISNPTAISNQENNNDSVQLNGISQSGSSGMEVLNHSDSASNVHQNAVDLSSSSGISVTQSNDQYAQNYTSPYQEINNDDDVSMQNNNNGSVQVNDDAQTSSTAFTLSNAASSAKNIGQNIANVSGSTSISVDQTNTQTALVDFDSKSDQYVANYGDADLQNNNVGSVQLNDNAQRGASGLVLSNSALTAENIGQNIESVNNSNVVGLSQVNHQYAYNDAKADVWGGIENYGRVDGQNNNVGSVQVNDNAQRGASASALSNSALSAKNIGQNIATVNGVNGLTASQTNTQIAEMDGKADQYVYNEGRARGQNNNLASVQLNNHAQQGASGEVIANTAYSAENIGQNVLTLNGLTNASVAQTNDQYASIDPKSDQSVENNRVAPGQNNNAGSVQLNNHAQDGASGLSISNTALSAKNVGQNVISGSGLNGLNVLSQDNLQVAEKSSHYADQGVINDRRARRQDNNNASVQANNNAQININAMALSNTADSAENVGQNVVEVTGAFALNSIAQTNDQTATNDSYIDGNFQEVATTDSLLQRNNTSSVQLNDNAQNGVNAMTLSNTASSASNIGQNVATTAELVGYNIISQDNIQVAENYVYSAQDIENSSLIQITAAQDNNNGSVQLNAGTTAQNGVSAMAVTNSAASASNVGQNVATAANLAFGNFIAQSNDQYADNVSDNDQYISNAGLVAVTVGQDNNNASVQIEDGQNSISAMSVANSSASAVNVGQNVAEGGSIIGLNVALQENTQVASSSSWDYQTVDNNGALVNATIDQQNNNASVQIEDGQNSISAMSVANSSASAVNVGQNVAEYNSLAQIGGISQVNDQTSSVWMNEAGQDVYNDSWVVDITAAQNNNNGSVQVQDGQNSIAVMSLANSAGSAVNVGQNVADYNSFAQIGLIYQENTQVSSVDFYSWDGQYVDNIGVFGAAVTAFQNNNSGSVQLNGGQDFSGMSLANSAQSAVNVGQNVGSMTDALGINLIGQVNDQTATSIISGSEQYVINGSLGGTVTFAQDNNNNSVQANAGTEDGSAAMSILNSAGSAANVAQNVAELTSLVQIGAVGQANTQVAENYIEGSDQLVVNYGGIVEVSALQDNNNGSVQVQAAQDSVSSMSLANDARSALNVGQNVADIGDIAGLDLAYQTNDQYADVYVAGSGQTVYNYSDGVAALDIVQENNNASVQLSNAQNSASGMSLVNSAYSAANVGQNVASLFNPLGLSVVNQTNDQTALNGYVDTVNNIYEYTTAAQDITNDIAVAQNNNNGSVQLNGSQNSVTSLNVLNSVMSAVNGALNMADVTGSAPFGTAINQTNTQYAENASDALQNVNNNVVIAGQNNNNGSVQLNNSQVGTSALMLSNIAGSAHNYGINMASVSGATGWTINQTATQTAINW